MLPGWILFGEGPMLADDDATAAELRQLSEKIAGLTPEQRSHLLAFVRARSGRVLARGEAKRERSAIHDAIDAEMRDIVRVFDGVEITGVVGNTERTPLDECGHVYEDLDAVLGVMEHEGIARVARRLYPVANIKGTD